MTYAQYCAIRVRREYLRLSFHATLLELKSPSSAGSCGNNRNVTVTVATSYWYPFITWTLGLVIETVCLTRTKICIFVNLLAMASLMDLNIYLDLRLCQALYVLAKNRTFTLFPDRAQARRQCSEYSTSLRISASGRGPEEAATSILQYPIDRRRAAQDVAHTRTSSRCLLQYGYT